MRSLIWLASAISSGYLLGVRAGRDAATREAFAQLGRALVEHQATTLFSGGGDQ